ncbi:hypothetical protein CDAR_431461 [Caerostris darwini]|uniref:Uncharacterized protein n=1 Tax=Caerostris darwini TaxID=1538125 RepID=A0AAV4W4K5_9ARAC|nr:hypothetical protein CDAR_431461 [Caerostris darwini]
MILPKGWNPSVFLFHRQEWLFVFFLVLPQCVLNHEWILLLFQGDPCDNVVEDVSVMWSFPPPRVLLLSVLNHEWILLLFQGDPCDNVVEDVSVTWSFPAPGLLS